MLGRFKNLTNFKNLKFVLKDFSPRFLNQQMPIKYFISQVPNISLNREKRFYNKSEDIDLNQKHILINSSLKDLLDYYEQNSEMTESFFVNYLQLLCLKIENTQHEFLFKLVNNEYKYCFGKIFNRYCEDSQNINSNEKIFAYTFYSYLIHKKAEFIGIDIKRVEGKLNSILYLKYFDENYNKFNFFEKITFFSVIGFSGREFNYEKYFEDDYWEITKIGYFELSRIVRRIIGNKENTPNKQKILELIITPYIKMSLEADFINKVISFKNIMKVADNFYFMDLQHDIEKILISIMTDVNDFHQKKSHIVHSEFVSLFWISNFLSGIKLYKGKKVDKEFLNKLINLFFEHNLKNCLGTNIFKNLNLVYNLSDLNYDNILSEMNMLILSDFMKKYFNENYLAYDLIRSQMMCIFLFMKKTKFVDKALIQICVDHFLKRIHEFPIVENSHAFKEIVKEHNDYEKIKNVILENLYKDATSLKIVDISNWSNILSIMCFYAEEPNTKTDAIMDIFIQILVTRKLESSIFIVRFLVSYNDIKQNYVFPNYKVKIIKKICQILNMHSMCQFLTAKAYANFYVCFNQLKLPEKNAEELKKIMRPIISLMHELCFSEYEFITVLKVIAENKRAITNSTLISCMMTSKTFIEKNKYFVNKNIQENLILFLYAVLKNESNIKNIDRDVLVAFTNNIDRIFPYNKENKFIKTNFDQLVDILFVFLKNNLRCELLISNFIRECEIFENKLKNELDFYNKIKKLYDDLSELKILNKIVEIKNFLELE